MLYQSARTIVTSESLLKQNLKQDTATNICQPISPENYPIYYENISSAENVALTDKNDDDADLTTQVKLAKAKP